MNVKVLFHVYIAILLYKNLVKQYFSSGKKMESYEVMDWFNTNQSNIPTISYFASIIHSIPPSQIENERDFSLAGVNPAEC